MSVLDVHISLNGQQFVPSPDPITLSKNAGNTIKWFNDTGEAITISFDAGSPFPANKNPYAIPIGNHKDSGAIQAAPDTNWKYTISGPSGTTDPEVVIQP